MSSASKVSDKEVRIAYDYLHSGKADCEKNAKPALQVIQKMNYDEFSSYVLTGEIPAIKLSPKEMETLSGGWVIKLGGYQIRGGKNTPGDQIRGDYTNSSTWGFET